MQRLASAVNRIAPDSEVRQILIESLAFENANSECESVVRQDQDQKMNGLEIRPTLDLKLMMLTLTEVISKFLRKIKMLSILILVSNVI